MNKAPPGHAPRRIQCIGHYDLDKTIGQGQFGKVKLATHVLTGERVAVKIILKAKLDEETLRKVYREVRIMKLLNHPNIIKLYEVIETEKVLFLVMEYASGGEVLDFIVAHGRLSEPQARKFFQQIVSAVDYCHKHRVIHRDIKCENLLLDADLNIKIIDFGLSNCFTPGGKMQTFCGSPTYCAPELIQRHKYEGPEIDVWSLGVVLFVLVCGYLPFDAKDFQTLFRKILSGNYAIPEYVSEDCAHLISSMLVGEPEYRATLQDVAKHPWIQMDPKVLEVNNIGIEEQVETTGEIDLEILEQMVSLGFLPETVRDSVYNDKYDVAASTYYLLLGRKWKNRGIMEPLQDSRRLHGAKDLQAKPEEKPQGVTRGGRGHRRHHTEGVMSQNAAPPQQPPLLQENKAVSSTATLRVSSPDPKKSPPSVHVPSITVNKPPKPAPPSSPQPSRPSPASTTTPSATTNSNSNNNSAALTQFWKVQKTHKRARSVDHHQDAVFENPSPPPQPGKREESPKKNLSPQRPRQSQNSMRGSRRHTTARPKSIEQKQCINLIEANNAHHYPENEYEEINGDDGETPKEPPQSSPRRLTADTFVPPTPNEFSPKKAPTTSTTTSNKPSLAVSAPHEPSDEGQEQNETSDAPKQAQTRPKRDHRRTQSLGTERVPEKQPETQNVIDEYSNKLYPPAPKSPRQSSLNAFMTSFRNAIGLMKKETKPAPEPRTTRFALNVSMTSSKSAEEIMAEVVRVLDAHGIQYSPSPGQQFEVVCKHKYNEEECLIFEIEICKLPMLSMNGLRLNRISGDAWVYKKVAADLIEEMEL